MRPKSPTIPKTTIRSRHAWKRSLLLGLALASLAGAAPGDLRVAWVGAAGANARMRVQQLRRSMGAGVDLRAFAASLPEAAKADVSIWADLRSFRPQVAVFAFEPPRQPSAATAQYQAAVTQARALPTGPQIIVCAGAADAASPYGKAIRDFKDSAEAKYVQFANLEAKAAKPGESLPEMVRNAIQRPEDTATIQHGNSRTLEEIDAAYASMPAVSYTPPPDRFRFLPRARRVLKSGGALKVVMLGDSIINDTSRSAWDLLVERDYPKVRIAKITSVRGSTGCKWYREPGRVDIFVLDHDPDLVIIGGISQGEVGPIRDVIQQIRSRSKADIFLMTGAFGGVDPNQSDSWQQERGKPYTSELRALAEETGAQFLDLQAAWGEYISGSGKETKWFMRDRVHANEKGEQILGRILEQYFAPAKGK